MLLARSFYLSNEVYLAMQSRGFRGDVDTLDEFSMRSRDWAALLLFIVAAVIFFMQGRQAAGIHF